MTKQKQLRNLWYLLLVIPLLLTGCQDDETTGRGDRDLHTEAAQQLMMICETNTEVKQLLEHAIRQAAKINPDRQYNPAQTLEEFYDFIDRNVRCLPWEVMMLPAPNDYGHSLYGRTDQGIGYFWFVVDQPLDELRDRGYFYPTVEFVEPFASWLSTYSNSWGDWLSTTDSWNDTYYNMVWRGQPMEDFQRVLCPQSGVTRRASYLRHRGGVACRLLSERHLGYQR